MSRFLSLLVAVSVASTSFVGVAGAGAPIEVSPRLTGVCDGTQDCKVVATRDVDGDGHRDRVGRVLHPDGRVTMRVLTSEGMLRRKTVDASDWYGDPWHGAAGIDGRRGVELVVGHLVGAHTEFFKVLTWRAGELVVERDPSGDATWVVDSSVNFNIGVWRRVVDGEVLVRLRSAVRGAAGHGHNGRDVTYHWAHKRWNKVSSIHRHYRSDAAAFRIGGWHVGSLPRF